MVIGRHDRGDDLGSTSRQLFAANLRVTQLPSEHADEMLIRQRTEALPWLTGLGAAAGAYFVD
jgi:hypothetical protein